MRILVDIGHPGHIHFFKYAIWRWGQEGHAVKITARDKDVTLALLDRYHFPYDVLTSVGYQTLGMFNEYLQREWKLGRIIRQFKPDVVTAVGGAFVAPISKLMRVPAVVFTDSEHVALDRYLTYPLAETVYTPECFKKEAGPRHVRYRGFQELAYLHPRYFTPDPNVLDELHLDSQEPFTLLRFIAWGAAHDVGQSGFNAEQKLQLVQELAQKGRVFVSIEGPVPHEIKPYTISLSPEKIHHLLYYASLYVGEGATMATEAGILGTPSVYLSSLVGTMGNFDELMNRQLVYSYRDADEALGKAIEFMEQDDTKAEWQRRRERLLREKIDVTAFVYEKILEYGERAEPRRNSRNPG